MRRSFWVLQWSDGTYYAKGRISGYESVERTANPLAAVHFDTLRYARDFHDTMGHFWHQDMMAVKIKMSVDKERSRLLRGRVERKKERWEED